MRSQRVAHAGEAVGAQAGTPQLAQRLGGATRYGSQVVHGRHVARRLAQRTPVQHEHVVPAAPEVRWGKNQFNILVSCPNVYPGSTILGYISPNLT